MIPPLSEDLVQCYWVLPGRFLAGEYPAHLDRPQAAERLDALLEAGIDSFFDLTEPGELRSYHPLLKMRAARRGHSVNLQRFPIPDFGVPTWSQMRVLLDSIDLAVAEGRKIYVHCWGGIGRTGMTVGCYLVRHGESGGAAIDQISAWRRSLAGFAFHPHSPETTDQADFVRKWTENPSEGDR